jgi:hypothetical protein
MLLIGIPTSGERSAHACREYSHLQAIFAIGSCHKRDSHRTRGFRAAARSAAKVGHLAVFHASVSSVYIRAAA